MVFNAGKRGLIFHGAKYAFSVKRKSIGNVNGRKKVSLKRSQAIKHIKHIDQPKKSSDSNNPVIGACRQSIVRNIRLAEYVKKAANRMYFKMLSRFFRGNPKNTIAIHTPDPVKTKDAEKKYRNNLSIK